MDAVWIIANGFICFHTSCEAWQHDCLWQSLVQWSNLTFKMLLCRCSMHGGGLREQIAAVLFGSYPVSYILLVSQLPVRLLCCYFDLTETSYLCAPVQRSMPQASTARPRHSYCWSSCCCLLPPSFFKSNLPR